MVQKFISLHFEWMIQIRIMMPYLFSKKIRPPRQIVAKDNYDVIYMNKLSATFTQPVFKFCTNLHVREKKK